MVKIKCPGCHLGFEADHAIGAHRLACECGEKWLIPELPAGVDIRLCVVCGRISPLETTVCPECEFNFLSGYCAGGKAKSRLSTK